jgi:integrase
MYNQYVSVLKIIYKGVLSQNKVDDVRCVKIYPKLKRLPDIIKVYNTINSIKNLKHKAILMTALKTGLRMNELISLKVSDIDRRQMKILIEQSKGGNSEFALLTNELLSLLEAYWLKYKPSNYLFEGQYGGKYSASSVNKIVKKYIGSQYSIHWLRHLAITYVINKNMPMPKVKLFSRHKSDNAVHFYYHYDDNTFNETRFLMDNIAG